MNALLSQLALDGKLVVRHRFLHVVVLMAALFGLLVRFALPEHLSPPARAWLHDAAQPIDSEVHRRVASEAALREKLEVDREAVGMSFAGAEARLLLRGSEPPASVALARSQAEATWLQLRGVSLKPSHRIERLRERTPPPPFSLTQLPVLLAVDVVFFGFLFASVMLLQEKTQGTVRFFRTAPASTLVYVSSKVLVNLGLGFVGTAVLFGVALPRGLTEPGVWALVTTGSLALTSVGLGTAAFFRNLSGFFYPLVVVGLGATVPMAGYLVPTVELGPLKLLPTWGVMFGAREVLFPTGARALVFESLLLTGGSAIVGFSFALVAVRRFALEVRS